MKNNDCIRTRENCSTIFRNNLWAMSLVAENAPSVFIFHAIRTLLLIVSVYININYTRWILCAIENHQTIEPTITLIVGITFIFILCNLFLSLYNNILLPQKQIDIGSRIREHIIRKISRIDQIEFQNNQFYDLYMLGLREIDTRPMAVLNTSFDLIGALLEFTVLVGVSATISKGFAIFGILAALLDVGLGIKRNKLNYNQSVDVTPDARKRGYINRIITQPQFFSDQKVYPGFSELLIDEYRRTTHSVKSILLSYAKKIFGIDQVQQISGTMLRQMLPWLFIAALLFQNKVTIAEVTVLSAASLSIPSSLTRFLNSINVFYSHSMYVGNLKYIFDYAENIEAIQDEAEDVPEKLDISIQNLGFSYSDESRIVFDNISLDIPYGKKIAIVGGNGSGKSTLLKMLVHLYNPSKGQIFINGKPLDDYNVHSVRSRIAYLAQDHNVYSFSISENVLMRPVSTPGDRLLVQEALEKVGLWSKVKEFPNGIDTFITKEFDSQGEYLSGGEIQKLVLARIYAGNYSCIIMDESTSAIDPVSEDEIIRTLLTVFRNKTIIFVSHKLSIVNSVDSVYYFSGGRIVGGKSHYELINENREYEEFYLKQAKKFTL